MPELRPTDEQRARWQDAIATDLNGLDWWERRDDLIVAIFAAGAKAALDGAEVQWATRDKYGGVHRESDEADAQHRLAFWNGTLDFGAHVVTRRVTDWQAAPDA